MVGRKGIQPAPTATLRKYGEVGSSGNGEGQNGGHMDGILRDRDLLEGMTQRRPISSIRKQEQLELPFLGIDIPLFLEVLLSGIITKDGHSRRHSRRTSRRWRRNSPIFICLLVMICFVACGADCSAVAGGDGQTIGAEKEVSVVGYTYDEWSVLEGVIKIKDISYEKSVTVVWATGDSQDDWKEHQKISARWSAGPDKSGYEFWRFLGSAERATQFYVMFEVAGKVYYAPGNYENYKVIPWKSTTTSTEASTSTSVSPPIISSSTIASGTAHASSIPTVLPVQPPSILLPDHGIEPPQSLPDKDGCSNWNGLDSCPSGTTYTFPDAAESRRWQTPSQKGGDSDYVSTFQDYSDLIGYADIQYSPLRDAAAVVVNAASRTGEELEYFFNGVRQRNNSFQALASDGLDGLDIVVKTASGKTLVLDTLHFLWQNSDVRPPTGANFRGGQRGAIVELFGWPYKDVGKECEFLAKAGYMGVKIWPATEHLWGSNLYEPHGEFRPWYLVYQPVSYRLNSRMGTRAQLRSMVKACRAAGVRVYADAVVNHMTGQAHDIQSHRRRDESDGTCRVSPGRSGSAGSPFYTSGDAYKLNRNTQLRPALEFPAVPYGPTDFHCERPINVWTDGQIITKGWLVSLTDLNTEKEYVQDRIATYLVDLLSLGLSGFRIDAAKHIGPASTAQILRRVKAKMGGVEMPEDWLVWLEVIMGGEAQLLACGGGEWSWYTNLDNQLLANGFSRADIHKVKIWSSDYPKEHPICRSTNPRNNGWVIPASRFAIQNDDHDQQSPGSSSRDMGSHGSVLAKDKNVERHRRFEKLLFSRSDAQWDVKLVLSGYLFMENGASGFPDGWSDCGRWYTGEQDRRGCLSVPLDRAYVEGACGYGGREGLREGRYTRVHRDLEIVNAMRRWIGLGGVGERELGIEGCGKGRGGRDGEGEL
ncbi:glycoside hydrolase superfamily [Peziza echinospora]|nr:glycoside hydrolase superfamily [Peziza echinospora]